MFLLVQIGNDRVAAELVKEAVGAFLLIRDSDVLIHVFAVARPGGDEAADDDVFLEAAQVVHLALEAASVSTLVVSWKDAAEMKDEVVKDAA